MSLFPLFYVIILYEISENEDDLIYPNHTLDHTSLKLTLGFFNYLILRF